MNEIIQLAFIILAGIALIVMLILSIMQYLDFRRHTKIMEQSFRESLEKFYEKRKTKKENN